MAAAIKTTSGEKAARQDTFRVNPADVKEGKNARMIASPDYIEKVRELAADVHDHGQLQPSEVRRDEDNSLVLTFGFTRKHAIELLREGFEATDPVSGEVKRYHDPKAMLWVRVIDCGIDDAFVRGLKENIKRNDMTDLQEARAQEELRTGLGWTDTQIARFFGSNNQNRVMALAKLLTLSKKIQEAVHEGRMALSTALDAAKVTDEAEREAIVAGAFDAKGKVSGPAVREAVRAWAEKVAELEAKLKAAEAGAVEGGGEGDGEGDGDGDGDGEGDGKEKEEKEKEKEEKGPSIKRNVKDFKKFVEEIQNDEEEAKEYDEAVLDLLVSLTKYFDGKNTYGPRAIKNRLKALKKR